MKKNKIITPIILAMLLIFSYATIAIETYGENRERNASYPSNIEGSLPYKGHLRIYVVEPVSRWNNYEGEPYHFGFLDFAFNDIISVDYQEVFTKSITWNGNQAGFGDIQENNIIVMAALFNPEIHKGYSNPPIGLPFETHYVDAAATPGNSASNTVNEEFTHTVFVEEATAAYFPYCPAMANALHTVYESGDYPFYFTALITKNKQGNIINQIALDYLVNNYNFYAYPTAHFDGGYKTLVGGYDNPDTFSNKIQSSSKRDVHDLDFTVSLEWMDNSELKIDISITNNEEFFNSPPEKPTITGPTSTKYGEEHTYEITATDPDDNDIYYYIDFGDDTEEIIKGPYDSGKTTRVKHTWEKQGTYTIKVKSRDTYDEKSDWATLEVSMQKNKQTNNCDNNPPNPPMITGPTSGKIDETYLYNVTITDPDEDDVMFNLEVDFGDEIVHEDCGCGQSWQNGTVVEVYHKWLNVGSYGITARVQDAYGEWSEWSYPLSISMLKSKPYINTPLINFLENHPNLFPILRQLLKL